jgi:hypothetical protein
MGKFSRWPPRLRYAPSMEQSTASAPSPSSSSFAAFLASLTAPAQNSGAPDDRSSSAGWNSASAWSDDGLEDDVATLSYERALRAHARYHSAGITEPTESTDRALTQAANLGPVAQEESPLAASKATPQPASHSKAVLEPIENPEPEANRSQVTPFDRNLKDASITIRMSKAECEQLHRRAAEAGLICAPARLKRNHCGQWSKTRWPSCALSHPAEVFPLLPAALGFADWSAGWRAC